MKRKAQGYKQLYRDIAIEREPFGGIFECKRCGRNIGRLYDLNIINFAHIKSKGSRPDLKYDKSNIEIVCAKCHRSEHSSGTVYMQGNW